MTPPNGYAEIVATFGDPKKYLRDDGTISPLWEARMASVPFPEPLPLGWDPLVLARGARVHSFIADETRRVFELLAREGLWKKLRTFDGGYAWRPQRGSSTKLSLHSFGAALDFDAATNQLGTSGDMDQGVIQVFEAAGWSWGGRWARPDPMHYNFARGY
jgi:hypothetical protein